MTVVMTAMRPSDAERCAELEAQLFVGGSLWSAEAFRSELAHRHNRYVVIRDEARTVIGYAGIALLGNPFSPESEVHNIGVDPAYRRKGLGTLLLSELLRLADEHGGSVFLEVRTDNTAAIELYRREGFEIVGTRRKYYRPSGADAYTMRRRGPST
ncbi:ribosomal protein S18-alanine N-acetyltransferase [Rhodococcus sp. NPDC057529]|uniref:ribosomal protein S18-alanine N-acetyltransferase n=1 Tax=Rhodococcus sp. NPDC057529 TaxID=3346158 RepID=UPI00366C889D